ncbi:MAG TPA: hypothetical protein VFY14_07850, partial [Streptomyces sp.]|nr:hypothetical protein [Streptomyces sp.]
SAASPSGTPGTTSPHPRNTPGMRSGVTVNQVGLGQRQHPGSATDGTAALATTVDTVSDQHGCRGFGAVAGAPFSSNSDFIHSSEDF